MPTYKVGDIGNMTTLNDLIAEAKKEFDENFQTAFTDFSTYQKIFLDKCMRKAAEAAIEAVKLQDLRSNGYRVREKGEVDGNFDEPMWESYHSAISDAAERAKEFLRR